MDPFFDPNSPEYQRMEQRFREKQAGPSYDDVRRMYTDEYQRRYREGEQLDPETQATLGRARAHAVGLRGRPLVAGRVARDQIQKGLAEQHRLTSGATPESRFATTQRGATLGSQVLKQQGPKMAAEAGQRFGVGMETARIHRLAKDGQTLFAVAERILDSAAAQGIMLAQEQATAMATAAIVAGIAEHDWSQYGTPDASPHMPAVLPNTQPGLPADQAYA